MENKFVEKLKGERLELRINVPEIELAKKIFATVDENRDYLSKWLPWVDSTQKVEDSLKFLFDTQDGIKSGKKVNYGIFLDENYVGNIGFFDIDWKNKSGEIGYWLSEKYSKNGYVSEAVKILEKEFFEKHDFNRIQIKCDTNNIGSGKVALKCGYLLEGVIREDAYVNEIGGFRSTNLFSKLKSEYFQ